MDPVLAISALQKAAAVLAFTGVLAPLAGLVLKRAVGGWSEYGRGPFAILSEAPRRRGGGAGGTRDAAIQAAEVRQLLAAKDERLRRRGEPGLDVEAEARRLLAEAAGGREPDLERPQADAELRAEVRQLVLVRNERRRRQGLAPLDVEAEIARQLASLTAP